MILCRYYTVSTARLFFFQYLNELTEDIVSFKPIPDLKVTDARILIIGPVGAGKSSFFNTINSIFRGRITQKARSGSAEQSLTTAVSIKYIWTTNS
jgi:polynucleotide 5'-kinase involved in rRNA processing